MHRRETRWGREDHSEEEDSRGRVRRGEKVEADRLQQPSPEGFPANRSG